GRTLFERAHAAAPAGDGSHVVRAIAGRHAARTGGAVSGPAQFVACAGGLYARLRRSEKFFPRLQALVQAFARAISRSVVSAGGGSRFLARHKSRRAKSISQPFHFVACHAPADGAQSDLCYFAVSASSSPP